MDTAFAAHPSIFDSGDDMKPINEDSKSEKED